MKHYIPTRRKKALRRFVTLLLLLAFLHLCGYHLTPQSLLEDVAEQTLLEDLRIVGYLPMGSEMGKLICPLVAANEHEFVRVIAYYGLFSGWKAADKDHLVPESAGSVSGSFCYGEYQDGTYYSYLYGKITDNRIVRWELQADTVFDYGDTRPMTSAALPIAREQWLEQDGSRYFLLEIDLESLGKTVGSFRVCDVTMRCYDSAGELVEEAPLGVVTVS